MTTTTQTTTQIAAWPTGSHDMIGVRLCADMARRSGVVPNSNGSLAVDVEPMLDEAIDATLAWANG